MSAGAQPPSEEGIDELFNTVINFMRGESSGEVAGVFRLAVGTTALVNSVLLFVARNRYYGKDGLLLWSEAKSFPENGYTLLTLAPTNDDYLTALFVALIAANVLYLVGFFARAASLLMGAILVSLHHRNPYVLNGGDNLLLQYLWLGALLPLDARYSLRKHLGWIKDAPTWVFGQRLLQLLICYIYLYAFGAKAQQAVWLRGEAMLDVLASPMLARFPVHLGSHLISALASYATLAFESLFPLLIFHKKATTPLILIGVAFHVGIEATLKIPLFSAMMLASYVLFYSDDEVREMLGRLRAALFPR